MARRSAPPLRVPSLVLLALALAGAFVQAQVTGPNVNLVSGKGWPGGDPFLQRQNEPTVAVSTRNPMHLMAGANDYRTVDLPGLPEDRETGDAWLGVFTSYDGGATWRSTLLPGYPQEQGSASPLFGYDAGADPTVRAGTNGLFYYSGIAFDRENPVLLAKSGRAPRQPGLAGVGSATSAVFVARYIDNNQKENGESIGYLGTSIVASNATDADVFLDKPWIAVDVPRRSSPTCRITQALGGETVTQSVPAGHVYAAFSRFRKDAMGAFTGELVVSRSTDCGVTWSAPLLVSADHKINQGASVAVDPRTGTVYVAWRRFAWPRPAAGSQPPVEQADAILIARSLDRGRTFSPPEVVAILAPFDQGSSPTQFRTNGYPSLAVDRHGRVYVAFSTRGVAPSGDARVVMSSVVYRSRARVKFADEDDTEESDERSDPRVVWPAAAPIDPDLARRGHQLMPAALVSGEMLQIAYVDLQEDHTWGEYKPTESGLLRETRVASAERESQPQSVFSDRIDDRTVHSRRHTADVFVAQAAVGASPVFAIQRVSSYRSGIRPEEPLKVQQLQFNPPNLPLFKLGTTPFWGDYIDAGALAFVGKNRNKWRHALKADSSFVVFTDNRDVRPPLDGRWDLYTPPESLALGTRSLFDPNQIPPACDPLSPERAGMRNQNIYGARVSRGVVVGVPGNAKPLGPLQRGYVVFVENTTYVTKTFRLTIVNQPTRGSASFRQFGRLTVLGVTIAPRSSVSRTLYVSASDRKGAVDVTVQETSGGVVVPPASGGLEDSAAINPDMTNPDMTNPDMTNPDMTNADVLNVEVHTPDMTNPDMTNPDMTNAGVVNPDMTNPDMTNPDMTNPDMTNPDVVSFNPTSADVPTPDMTNPDMTNPDMTNPDMTNTSMTDTIWTITNLGNTTSAYDVRLLLRNASLPAGFKTQLMIYKTYETPVARDCQLLTQTQNLLIATIPNPPLVPIGGAAGFDPADGSLGHATLWLAPGDTAKVALRVLDPDKNDGVTFDPITSVTAAAIAQAVDTTDAASGVTQPTPVTPDPPVLSFEQPPSTTPVGGLVSPTVRVWLRDHNGTGMAGVTIALSLVSGPAGASVHGGSAVTAPDGRATFPSLYLDRVGTAYVLRATAAGVSSVSGSFDVLPLVVTSVGDSGAGSLRVAIENANRNAGYTDAISFAVGSGAITIAPTSALPAITDGVTLDAMTQPGYAGIPLVRLDGGAAGAGANGLLVQAPGVSVRGLAITRFSGSGVTLDHASAASIEGNYVGTDGTVDLGNAGDGITLSYSSSCVVSDNVVSGNDQNGIRLAWASSNVIRRNRIGTNAAGDGPIGNAVVGIVGTGAVGSSCDNVIGGAPGEGNLVSGNVEGISLQSGTCRSRVEGNYVGTNAAGSSAIPNTGGHGIGIYQDDNIVRGNVISGNTSLGLRLDIGHRTLVQGNLVGTDASGTVAVPNGIGISYTSSGSAYHTLLDNVVSGNLGDGIALFDADHFTLRGNRIGTTASGAPLPNGATGIEVQGCESSSFGGPNPGDANVISANGGWGMVLRGVSWWIGVPPTTHLGYGVARCDVTGNLIGLAPDGTPRANGAGGVLVQSDPEPGPGAVMEDVTLTLNTISGNNGPGLSLREGAHGVSVVANRIGTRPDGMAAVGNANDGVLIEGPSTQELTIGSNLLSGNAHNGIRIQDEAHDLRIVGNHIGTNVLGTGAVANGWDGIRLGQLGSSATRVTVGGALAGARNVVSGNLGSGISLEDAHDVTIQGNFVGTDESGGSALANGTEGIGGTDSGDVVIGGLAAGAGNVISGNDGPGVSVAHNVSVELYGNSIGTDASGATAVPNASHGISIGGTGATVTVGSADPLGPNVISGNGGVGVDTWIATGLARLYGNFIGTNRAGLAALPNVQGGVQGGHATTIGGAAPGEGNVISGNSLFGVRLTSSNAVLSGNRIGTDASGSLAVPNVGPGVWISGSATNSVVGGGSASDGNTIAFNQGDGILDTASTGTRNAFGSNRIHSNDGLGIDLGGDGVSANDADDGDVGPNDRLNFPVIIAASDNGSETSVAWAVDLEPIPGVTLTIQLFTSPTCDASGHGEAAEFRDQVLAVTNGSGDAGSVASLPTGLLGQALVATTTVSTIAAGGATSEFSSCVVVGP